ncbi:unnamed protein product [Ilex paraguariensis]|uniref:non-specific serine/threonine protein kinase n=1 Tax=Ilex paraguariensis TaxID=185542 RepID=A0ABC8SQS3_9AQUA
MGSFPGNCEIVESKEERSSVEQSEGIHQLRAHDKERRPPVPKKGSSSSLEDDINKLFEAISLKSSSKGLSPSDQFGTGSLKKNTLKQPMRVGVSASSGIGFSEPVSLKQALRGLCISQAAEMAAMKRLSKSPGSPRLSEVGKITSMYRSVVVEAGGSSLPLAGDKEGRVEISLVPEERTSKSSEKNPQCLQESKVKSLNHSSPSSPRFVIETAARRSGSTLGQNGIMPASTEVGTWQSKTSLVLEESTSNSSEKMPQCLLESKVKPSNLGAHSSTRFALETLAKRSGSTLRQIEIVPAPNEIWSRQSKASLVLEESTSDSSERMPQCLQEPKVKPSNRSTNSSPRFAIETTAKRSGSTLRQIEVVPALTEVGIRGSKTSQVIEESISDSSEKMPECLLEPKVKSSNHSAHSSPRFAVEKTSKRSGPTLKQDEIVPASTELGTRQSKASLVVEESTSNFSEKMPQCLQGPKVKSAITSTRSSPRFAVEAKFKSSGTPLRQHEIVPESTELGTRRSKASLVLEESTLNSSERMLQYLQELKVKPSNLSAQSSPQFTLETTAERMGSTVMQNEIEPTSTAIGNLQLRTGRAPEENHTSLHSLPCLYPGGNMLDTDENISAPVKLASNVNKNVSASSKSANKAAPRLRRKGRLQSAGSSSSAINSTKVSKTIRNARCAVKPVIRNKNFVTKKSKQDSSSVACTSDTYDGVLDPNTSQLICQRCHCTLKDARKESLMDSPTPLSASVIAENSSSKGKHGSSKPGSTLNGCDISSPVVVKTNNTSKPKEKGEFSQSSKSSIGEYSSSTSISEESYLSGSSFGNRPHMSKDLRWEAIYHVTKQHGFLGLSHFNLLKKLGCGDIGTVYLTELIGTNCQFAIKVMDNEFLERRRKTPRAQTEREILRMLDHPFLPTLFAQFTSDNLSCLVMEYCPGGDLHVLRQKQLGRYFPEQAARFYVAEVLLALEYLHMLGVVYRDLKPENILVREDGHIMLTDFDLSLRCSVNPTLLKSSSLGMEPARMSGPCTGSSCIDPFCIEPSCKVSCFSPRFLPAAAKTRKQKADLAAQVRSLPQLVAEPTDARSNSFVGTHEYLAPEIIKGEGHGSAVDWWTFGIFLYELLYGRTPFKGFGNEETLANVVLQSLSFPDTPLVSLQARDLIRGLLVKEPENRTGSERGAAEIKQHPFFEGLNWALIRCAIPPQVPEACYFGAPKTASQEKGSKYLDFKAIGEHLEFELF